MRDFNELLSEERTFKVRDQVFEWREVRPEVLTAFVERQTTNGTNMNDPNAAFDLMDKQICLFLSTDDQKRWKELRKRTEEPVTIKQIEAVVTWLMEEQADRPTEQPSPSAPGPGKTEVSSTDA